MHGADDSRPVLRVEAGDPPPDLDLRGWPFTLAPVAQLLRDGLDLPRGVTFLVGENGSGKSTIAEAVAMAYGLAPEGGTANLRHATRPSESPLHRALRLQRGIGAARWGFFLRAETMHGLYTELERAEAWDLRPPRGPRFHEMSHGESFLAVLRTRVDSPGFYVLDEPESALSFTACLGLVGLLDELSRSKAQVLCATHSPLLTALPGARILELDTEGLHERTWEELELVDHWRRYLDDPRRYLRHLLG